MLHVHKFISIHLNEKSHTHSLFPLSPYFFFISCSIVFSHTHIFFGQCSSRSGYICLILFIFTMHLHPLPSLHAFLPSFYVSLSLAFLVILVWQPIFPLLPSPCASHCQSVFSFCQYFIFCHFSNTCMNLSFSPESCVNSGNAKCTCACACVRLAWCNLMDGALPYTPSSSQCDECDWKALKEVLPEPYLDLWSSYFIFKSCCYWRRWRFWCSWA